MGASKRRPRQGGQPACLPARPPSHLPGQDLRGALLLPRVRTPRAAGGGAPGLTPARSLRRRPRWLRLQRQLPLLLPRPHSHSLLVVAPGGGEARLLPSSLVNGCLGRAESAPSPAAAAAPLLRSPPPAPRKAKTGQPLTGPRPSSSSTPGDGSQEEPVRERRGEARRNFAAAAAAAFCCRSRSGERSGAGHERAAAGSRYRRLTPRGSRPEESERQEGQGGGGRRKERRPPAGGLSWAR